MTHDRLCPCSDYEQAWNGAACICITVALVRLEEQKAREGEHEHLG